MNIVINNQNNKITDTINVDIIKTLSGEFSLNEIQNELQNFYYNKVIIDITAIKNYYDINSVINFLSGFDSNQVIILLNDSEVINSNSFLAKLVEHGYYNFTRNAAGINYLTDNPNTYDDVSQYARSSKPNSYTDNYNSSYNSATNIEQSTYTIENYKKNRKQTIIGVQNLTEHAGSTTLVHMMYKQLKLNYSVKAIEMNKQDFVYFRESDLSMCTSIDDLKLKIKGYSNIDVILIDLNEFNESGICDEIIYLIDPGTIKLAKLMKKDKNIVQKTKDGKIVLNRSSVNLDEISNFEYETKFRVFLNIPNFDDRKDRIKIIDTLLYKLGFNKQNPSNMGFFGSIFNKN